MSSFNSSYLFGEDIVSGWGWRYFFSFYSEFAEERNNIIFETSVFAGIFVTSVVANLAIAAALLKYPEMRTVNNCFLLNLTAADLAFVAGIPALIYARISDQWTLGIALCKFLPYSQVRKYDSKERVTLINIDKPLGDLWAVVVLIERIDRNFWGTDNHGNLGKRNRPSR